ncbi:MAG: glutamine--tRNA ligase/YqeY domain fusion protein [Christensenellales bacterium]|jgi:glutaminyl-tRNA synthetase
MCDYEKTAANFIEEFVQEDLASGRYKSIVTRFPPEPNGYLHIGHAKAICLDFEIAQKFNGRCNLRFDDTNPTKEDTEYVESIQEDIRWLGFEWADVFYASDYFEKLYEFAVRLIEKGKAYVCDLTAQQIRETRGTLVDPGTESPYRERSVQENLALFARMKAGELADGEKVLRAKIDMASPNLNMRDPVLYRIMHAHHHNTGDEWKIYPMYDFAHPLSDAIEGISHSLCTLEFEDHRPLYDWCVQEIGFDTPPRQIEFARLGLTRTIMSKRHLRRLVDEGMVDGWDDPRMPTLCGLRRRGYTAKAIREFCDRIGVAKANSTVDAAFLEHCVREDLNASAQRRMAVLQPLKVVLTNWEEGKFEELEVENNPQDPETGVRSMVFGRELYIERDDFMEEPVKKFFRLKPGGEVRLKNAYIIRCHEVVKNADGSIRELLCTYDPDSKSGGAGAERKVKGTLHWVEAQSSIQATVRLYDYLLQDDEDTGRDFIERFNYESIEVRTGCRLEASLKDVAPGERFQFLRQGYFVCDPDTEAQNEPVFNRIVGLRDSWAKQAAKAKR